MVSIMIDVCIKNCKISPETSSCCIHIDHGQIIDITKTPAKAGKVINAKNNLILPGLIDVHVHFRDPGLKYKENFKTGSQAAANGGFTTIMDMPNTIPPTNTSKDFKKKLKIASKRSIIDYALHAGISNLEEVKKIAELKPASFKIFMDMVDSAFMMGAFHKISKISKKSNRDIPITLHAENKDIINHCTEELKNNGHNSPEDYVKAHPSLAEEVAVSQALALSHHYNQKIHFCHISTIKSLEIIRHSKTFLNVSSEITPHHLFLDSSEFKKWGNMAKTNPPVRKLSEKILWNDLNQIDLIGTDHAPHTLQEKEKDVWNASPGIPNLEVVLKLLLTSYNNGKISLDSVKRLLCENPAKIFNLKNKGFIKKGMDADLVIIDINKKGTIKSDEFYSKAHYTPFEGINYQGQAVMTICRGNVVMENGEVLENKGNHVYN